MRNRIGAGERDDFLPKFAKRRNREKVYRKSKVAEEGKRDGMTAVAGFRRGRERLRERCCRTEVNETKVCVVAAVGDEGVKGQ